MRIQISQCKRHTREIGNGTLKRTTTANCHYKQQVPHIIDNTMGDLALLKLIPKEPGLSKAFDYILDDSISLEAASNEPYDIYDDESILRQNIRSSNPVKKMIARQDEARRLSNIQEPELFKGKASKSNNSSYNSTRNTQIQKMERNDKNIGTVNIKTF